MLIRKGVKLLEEIEGAGDLVERQQEYILSIRYTLNNGEVLAARPWEAGMHLGQSSDAFFEYRRRIDQCTLIPGLFYALEGMRIGGYRKVAISPHLAYGDKGIAGQIPPNAKLIAEIKVLSGVLPGKARWQEPEISEAASLTQEQLCARYEVAKPTLWRWRKAGRLPPPILIGTMVRWRRSAIEQWEADDRPHVSPCLDEAKQQRDHVHQLPFGPQIESIDARTEPSPSRQDERRQLMRVIDTETMLDLMLELALLIDEAGQWHGPPLEHLLKDGDAASHQWRDLANLLEKALSDSGG